MSQAFVEIRYFTEMNFIEKLEFNRFLIKNSIFLTEHIALNFITNIMKKGTTIKRCCDKK